MTNVAHVGTIRSMRRQHEEEMVNETVDRVLDGVARMLVHFRREILMAVGAAQASIDRLVEVANQAADELVALRAEIDTLQGQGVDVTAATAAADKLAATIATVKDEAANVPLTGDAESRADAAALAAVPADSTIVSSVRDADGTMEVHVKFPDGQLAKVALDADFNVTGVTDDTPADPADPAAPDPGTTGTPAPTPPDTPVGGDTGAPNPNPGDTPPPDGTVAGGEVTQPDGTTTPAAAEVPGSEIVQPPDGGATPVT